MKRYIKITNRGTVHRLFLEIIGLGTKQKIDSDKVGQWASGFKLATPAALRMGVEVVVSSCDAIGPFILRFAVEDINIEHEGRIVKDKTIVYKYSDGRAVYAPVTLGVFSEWCSSIGDDNNKFYPILREYIANARDEDKDFAWEAGVAEIRQAEPGTTAVYIEERQEMLDILSGEPVRYFKFFGQAPLFKVIGLGAIYPKSSPGETRRFNDYYLVDCRSEPSFYSSVFDYEVYGKDMVNEFRTIKDDNKFFGRLAKLFTRIRDKNLLRQIINAACSCGVPVSVIEARILGNIDAQEMSEDFKKLCREIWEEYHQSRDLVACGEEAYDIFMRTLGYNVFSFTPYVNVFWAKVGIKNTKAEYEERRGHLKFRSLDTTENIRLTDIISRFLERIRYYESVFKCPIGAMDDPISQSRGLCADNYSVIYIAEKIFFADDMEFLATLCHELDHYETKLPDNNYTRLAEQKDNRNAKNLILLGIALKALEDKGVDISTLHPDLISTKKSP